MVWQLLLNGVVSGATYALMAVGFALLFQSSKFFNLAYAGLYSVGAYVAYSFVTIAAWPVAIALPMACVLTGLLGCGLHLAVFSPMRGRGANPHTLLIASLGLYVILQNGISLIWGDAALSGRAKFWSQSHVIGGAFLTSGQIAIVAVALGTLALGWLFLARTQVGRIIRAVGDDSELVSLSGLDARRYEAIAHLASGTLASIAAVTTTLDRDLVPTMGFPLLAKTVVAFILGGAYSLPGAALGGWLLGIIENFSAIILPTQWMEAVSFVILLSVLLFKPRGLLGARSR